MPPSFQREREFLVAALRDAVQLCIAVQKGITPDTLEKKDKSPVTVADYGSQALICRAIHETFPDDPIIAEEGSTELRQAANAALAEKVLSHVRRYRPDAGLDDVLQWIDFGEAGEYSGRFWTLDPIDGTKGFLRGEQYAVALALIVDGRVAVGALGCPNLPMASGRDPGSLFLAAQGQGATVATLGGGGPTPLRVSATTDPKNARICESVESGHSKHDTAAEVARRLGITAPGKRLDSQAKYAVLAQGEADIYLRLPTDAAYREKIWDHAAGALVIEEAGGRVTDVAGRPLDFTRGRELSGNRGVVATNGHLHDAVLSVLRELGVE